MPSLNYNYAIGDILMIVLPLFAAPTKHGVGRYLGIHDKIVITTMAVDRHGNFVKFSLWGIEYLTLVVNLSKCCAKL